MLSREAQVKSLIRRRYARRVTGDGERPGGRERALRAGYSERTLDRLPPAVIAAWSGCGNVMADRVAAGARVIVDLGAGSGVDALIAASPENGSDLVLALDLTPDSLHGLRAANPRVVPVAGDYEMLPLADAVCDAVIANAAFNLALDRAAAFSEAYRILRPGGRLHICDLVRSGELAADLLADPMAWSTSLGGVPLEGELAAAIRGAGFVDISVHGHRAFPPVVSVRVDALKPPSGDGSALALT